MYLSVVSCFWICVLSFFVFLPLGYECYENQAHVITYERSFLLGLATAAPSKTKPTGLPGWVPARESTDDVTENETTRRHKRGKKGGLRQRLKKRKYRVPLPTVTLGNVRSISNKIDEIRGLARFNSEFRNSSILCFTETWLNSNIPNQVIDINDFQLIRQDRSKNGTNKTKGGGLCFYMNEKWCRNYTVRNTICQPDIELMCVSFRPFYLPREFNQVHVILAYIPPDANANVAANVMEETVQAMETASPDSPKIVLGDFNHCQLEDSLIYQQFVESPTRGNRVLDKFFCSVKNSYKAVIRPCIGNSDHAVVHLLPKYRQKLKTEKVKNKIVMQWSENSIEDLQTCFDLTDWETLVTSCKDLDEAVDVVNSYVIFCQNLFVKPKTVKCYPNNKPWVRKELKALLAEKRKAFQKADNDKVRELNAKINTEVAMAKRNYKEKLENHFRSNNPREAWDCMRTLTSSQKERRHTPAFVNDDPVLTANELNRFYSRFDTQNFSDLIDEQCAELRDSLTEDDAITVHVTDVAKLFKRVNTRKATGPDNIGGKVLKSCAWQLAVPFQMLFQKSFDLKCLPVCWKSAVIVPVAKKQHSLHCNDFRPVALTSIAMKCFERLFMQQLLPSVSPLIDSLQFAYQPKKSVNDAVLALIQRITEHTDNLGCYARACFADFSSAFNTMQVHVLIEKLKQFRVKPALILWIKDFLMNRKQRVKVKNALSDTITINTGSPQGCVLSALLFIIYTNDCKAEGQGVSILKYADDTVILGLVKNEDEIVYRQNIQMFERWCDTNFLFLNSSKTKEIVFDFRRSRKTPIEPLSIKGSEIEMVTNYKYLDTVVDDKLTWSK